MLARNPADVLDAKLQQFLTGTKSKTANFSKEEHAIFFEEFLTNAIEEANAIYNEAFAQYKSRNVPIHFVRFEELLSKPKETLEGVMQFLLDQKDLENTVA